MAKAPRTKLEDAFLKREEPEKQEAVTPANIATSQNVPPSRRGKKAVIFWTSPQAHQQLKILAMERNTTMNALMKEAINGLFVTYKKADIA